MKHMATVLFVTTFTLVLYAYGQDREQQARPQQSVPANASVTVFPVVLGEKPEANVTNVVGVLLERGGLKQVEVATAAYAPERTQPFAQQAAAFGTFAAAQGVQTDYALFATYLASATEGFTGVRGVLVDKKGTVVWSDEQRKGDKAFDKAKPDCPMTCSVFLVQQLRPTLHLADPMRQDAPEGKLAARMKTQSGIPAQKELDAMQTRLATLRQADGKAAWKVYPARIGAEWSAASATELADLLTRQGLAQATAVTEPIRFTTSKTSNEQQTLWSGARSLQQAVRAMGAGKEYLLFADFLMASDKKAGAVHCYVLTPDGELVIVDFQNSHHEDFQRIAPGSASACCQLVATRLAGHLRK